MKYINSPINQVKFRNQKLFIKRDDLLDSEFSGNKARKFYYFLKQDFKGIKKIVSYGSAQANSLYSLSVLAKLKGVKLEFFVSSVAPFLKQNPMGNYKMALENEAFIIETQKNGEENHQLILDKYKDRSDVIFIEEGGRVKEAEYGIKILAKEIEEFAKKQNLKDLNIFLPSGTGTTALFLQKNLSFDVFTTPCVGDAEYLKKQFFHLEANKTVHPKIISLNKKYHFGKLYKEFYEIHNELLKSTKIEFDLLYDSKGWLTLFNNTDLFNKNLLYIHQGGLLGNKSMYLRYQNKFLKGHR